MINNKTEGIIMALRSMAPEIIAVDEIGSDKDINVLNKAKYTYLPDAINIRTILTQHLYFRGSDSDAVEQTSRPFGGCWEHEC